MYWTNICFKEKNTSFNTTKSVDRVIDFYGRLWENEGYDKLMMIADNLCSESVFLEKKER